MNEMNRIRDVYTERDKNGKRMLYDWHNLCALYQSAVKERMFSNMLKKSIGEDVTSLQVLDVGCGEGAFLRKLIEWGAKPKNLVGSEFLEDRLLRAASISPNGVHWHLGGLDFDNDSLFDLVSAHTVFTSILNDEDRASLANEMWEKVKPGGWIMIFDFRYNNPSNSDVRKLTRKEMIKWWPSNQSFYQSGLLAPPLSRRLVGNNYFVAEFLTLLLPFLRSHFVYMARK
jgi:SAM-dependent methyltransferase